MILRSEEIKTSYSQVWAGVPKPVAGALRSVRELGHLVDLKSPVQSLAIYGATQ